MNDLNTTIRGYKHSQMTKKFAKSRKFVPAKLSTNKLVSRSVYTLKQTLLLTKFLFRHLLIKLMSLTLQLTDDLTYIKFSESFIYPLKLSFVSQPVSWSVGWSLSYIMKESASSNNCLRRSRHIIKST